MGDSCQGNSFGHECVYNYMETINRYNSFGNNASYNSMGNYCFNNKFGNGCVNNCLGSINSSSGTNVTNPNVAGYNSGISKNWWNYTSECEFKDGVSYVGFGSYGGSTSTYMSGIVIHQGVHGGSKTKYSSGIVNYTLNSSFLHLNLVSFISSIARGTSVDVFYDPTTPKYVYKLGYSTTLNTLSTSTK
jgi:hypothetical protein